MVQSHGMACSLILTAIPRSLLCHALSSQNASQWKDVLKEAIQLGVVIIILDRLGFLDGGRRRGEAKTRCCSLVGLFRTHTAGSVAQRLRLHVHTHRLSAQCAPVGFLEVCDFLLERFAPRLRRLFLFP